MPLLFVAGGPVLSDPAPSWFLDGVKTTIDWLKPFLLVAAGYGVSELRALSERRSARADRARDRHQRQLDEVYAPALSLVEEIQAIGKERVHFGNAVRDASPRATFDDTKSSVAYNNRIRDEKIFPRYRQLFELLRGKRGLVEQSTVELQALLVAFLAGCDRDEAAKISVETSMALERGGVGRDPQHDLYADFRGHVERLRQLL
jgi:hypothetical protein